jgi:DNA-binding transcriptional LysR family regulator
MNHTLQQLEVFVRVADAGSITRAAEELHITQPAVSIQLKKFQTQFELPLTEVTGRKLRVTEFGTEIAVAARKILEEVRQIEMKALQHKGQLTGKLKIAVVSTGKYVMPYFLADFLGQNPGVELYMEVTNRARVIQSLENNEVDFALVSVAPTHLNIERVELMQNKLFLVGNRPFQHPKGAFSKEILKTLPLIYREEGSGTRFVMEKFIVKNKLPVQKKMELTGNEAVKQAVIAGLGYSIMPLIGIKNELGNGSLNIIPVKGFPIKSVWNLIWLKGKKFAPQAQQYMDSLKKDKERIIRERFDWFEQY